MFSEILEKIGKRKRAVLRKDISLESLEELNKLHTEYAMFGLKMNADHLRKTIKHYKDTLAE